MDFPHEVRFSAGIGPAHFLAETTRPLGPRLSAFSPTCPSFYIEGFFLPPRIGGIFIYEEDKPIRGIGAIEKRHQMGMLAFTDGWHLSIASGT